MAVGLVRNKYLAATIGPQGFGMYSLLSGFFEMMSVFAGASMATGTTKYISEYYHNGDTEKTHQTFTLSVICTFSAGLLLTLVFLGAPSIFVRTFLSPQIARPYYLLFAAGFVWMTMRPVLLSVLQGTLQVKAALYARALTSFLDVVLVVILVYAFHIYGFFLSLLISAVAGSLLLFHFIRTHCRLRFRKVSPFGPVGKRLLTFGWVNLYLAALNLSSQYIQRMMILRQIDIVTLGIFQAAVSLTIYVGFINRSSAYYFFPQISQSTSNENKAGEINDCLHLLLLTSVPLFSTVILFSGWMVAVLYSRMFLTLSSLLFWFVLAQFIADVGTIFKLTVAGMARLGIHSVSVTTNHLLWIIVPFAFISRYGVASIAMGICVGEMAAASLNFMYLRKAVGLRLSSRNGYLLLVGILGFILCKSCSGQGLGSRLFVLLLIISGVGLLVERRFMHAGVTIVAQAVNDLKAVFKTAWESSS